VIHSGHLGQHVGWARTIHDHLVAPNFAVPKGNDPTSALSDIWFITQEVARLHGGRATASNAQPHGLIVEIALRRSVG